MLLSLPLNTSLSGGFLFSAYLLLSEFWPLKNLLNFPKNLIRIDEEKNNKLNHDVFWFFEYIKKDEINRKGSGSGWKSEIKSMKIEIYLEKTGKEDLFVIKMGCFWGCTWAYLVACPKTIYNRNHLIC